jgi:hypothetical protein
MDNRVSWDFKELQALLDLLVKDLLGPLDIKDLLEQDRLDLLDLD